MEEERYQLYEHNALVASNMSLDTTIMLVKALVSEYHNKTIFEFTIREEDKLTCCQNL